jgi:hypothetical protein
MTTYTVLALDPGGTTGWASYQAEVMSYAALGDETQTPKYEYYDEKWERGQLAGIDHQKALYTLMGLKHTDEYYIVCERFVERPDNKGAIDIAQKYIGVVELFAIDRQANLVMQMPAQAKGFVKDATIKKLGLWFPGQRHAMDATRHLLFFLVNQTAKRQDLLDKGWKF